MGDVAVTVGEDLHLDVAGLYDPRVLPVVTARGLANPWWAVVVAVLCFAVGSAAGIGWAYYLR